MDLCKYAQRETQRICQRIHVARSALTLKHKNTEWSTVIKINSSICCIVSGEKPSLKTAQRGSVESLVGCRLYGKMLRLYTALTLQSVASLLMKARGFCCYNWVLTGVNQRDTAKNKYVNKKCVLDSKGVKGRGSIYHFSKMITPWQYPQSWNGASSPLKVNKWQEWDLQPGFSVSQFSSTNH